MESVLTAGMLQLPSLAATTTKEIAVAVIQWSKEETHTEQLTAFVKYLEAQLRGCCDQCQEFFRSAEEGKVMGIVQSEKNIQGL